MTDEPMVLTIPGVVPSKGNSYRIARGRLVRARGAIPFEERVLNLLIERRARPVVDRPVRVVAAVYSPARHAPDVASCEKALLDALQCFRLIKGHRVPNPFGAGAYADDVQVLDFRAYRAGIDAENPRVIVTVEALPDDWGGESVPARPRGP